MKPPKYMTVIDPEFPVTLADGDNKAEIAVSFKTVEVPYDIRVEYQPYNDTYAVYYTYGGVEQGWMCTSEILYDSTYSFGVSDDKASFVFAKLATEGVCEGKDWPVEVVKYFGDEILKIACHMESVHASPKVSPKPSSLSLSTASTKLPGINSQVEWPCDCHEGSRDLWSMIQQLNDHHEGWDRERIADWIDDLHDNGIINAEFESWDDGSEAKQEEPKPDSDTVPKLADGGWVNVGWTDEAVGFLSNEPVIPLDALLPKKPIKMNLHKTESDSDYLKLWMLGQHYSISEEEFKNIKGDIT